MTLAVAQLHGSLVGWISATPPTPAFGLCYYPVQLVVTEMTLELMAPVAQKCRQVPHSVGLRREKPSRKSPTPITKQHFDRLQITTTTFANAVLPAVEKLSPYRAVPALCDKPPIPRSLVGVRN